MNVRVDTELNTIQHCTLIEAKAKANAVLVILGGVWPAG